MQDTKFHTFEIPRSNGGLPFKFAVHAEDDGRIQVTRISPYDETDYHWALKSAGQKHWCIIRSGRVVSTVGAFQRGKPDDSAEPLTPEQIAYFLIEADQKANLKPRICHN